MNSNLILFSCQVVCQPPDLPNNKYLTLQIYTGTVLVLKGNREEVD